MGSALLAAVAAKVDPAAAGEAPTAGDGGADAPLQDGAPSPGNTAPDGAAPPPSLTPRAPPAPPSSARDAPRPAALPPSWRDPSIGEPAPTSRKRAPVQRARFPTRDGESGLLDVPDAETTGLRGGAFILGLQASGSARGPAAVVPSPFALNLGLGRVEAGFALREGGRPGDPRPAALTVSTALKLHLYDATPSRPSLAVDVMVDRANHKPAGLLRFIASTPRERPLRAAAFVGGELDTSPTGVGPTLGAALSLTRDHVEVVAEAAGGPRGLSFGSALRFLPTALIGVSYGIDVLPVDRAVQATVTFAFVSPAPAVRAAESADEVAAPSGASKPKAGPLRFQDERPHFRLRIRPNPVPGEAPPSSGAAAAPPGAPPVTPAGKP